MRRSKQASPITTLLRRTIDDAVKRGETTYLALEQQTGVSRGSIARFVRGRHSLRLDLADRLAEVFGLELRRKG